MKNLIAQLVAATEGSRKLDVKIKIALDDPRVMTNPGDHRGHGVEWSLASSVFTEEWEDWEAAAMQIGAPHYTTSLDAARTMLPKDVWFQMGAEKTREDEPLYGAVIYRPHLDAPMPIAVGEHPTSLPLALCIAGLILEEALRA